MVEDTTIDLLYLESSVIKVSAMHEILLTCTT